MNLGELVVTFGLKGVEQAKDGLSQINRGFQSLKDMTWQTKAALIGALYGLERLASYAAGQGMAMRQFAQYTGLSTDQLQRWQVVAMRSGVSADEMSGAIQNVQNVMGKMRTGQGAPVGWADISRTVGLDFTKVQDTYYVMDKLREYAQKTKLPVTLANQYIESFVGNSKVVGMLRSAVTELDKVPKSLIMSRKELEGQANVAYQWDLFTRRLSIQGQRFAMAYAPKALEVGEKAFDWIIGVTKNIIELNKQFPILEKLAVVAGLAIAGAFKPITTIIAGITVFLDEWAKKQKGQENIYDFYKSAGKGMWDKFWETKKPMEMPKESEALEYQKKLRGLFNGGPKTTEGITPNLKVPTSGGQTGASININQSLNFQHEGKNAQSVATSVDQAIKNAFFQMQPHQVVT